jgi:hypothetical protein
MTARPPNSALTHTLVAVLELDDRAHPNSWPVESLGQDGLAAAALITFRLDKLPSEFNSAGAAWRNMPRALRAIVRHRNPALALYAAHTAGMRR